MAEIRTKAPFSFTYDDFQGYYGTSIENPQQEIREVCDFIFDTVINNSSINWRTATMSEYQRGILKEAAMEQLNYDIINGKPRNFSGINPTNGAFMDMNKLSQAALSPRSRQLLSRAGFFFKGVY